MTRGEIAQLKLNLERLQRAEAEAYVRSCGEFDGPDDDRELLTALFVALYERDPDADDWAVGVWSLCCAAVDSVVNGPKETS